jgi:hypothetical protein
MAVSEAFRLPGGAEAIDIRAGENQKSGYNQNLAGSTRGY